MECVLGPRSDRLVEEDWVPFVATNDYQRMTLFEYFGEGDNWTRFNDTDPSDFVFKAWASQTWLCFSILRQFLGPFFSHDEYVHERTKSDGSRNLFFTTRHLTSRLEDWTKHKMDNPIREEHGQFYASLLSIDLQHLKLHEELRPFIMAVSAINTALGNTLLAVAKVRPGSVKVDHYGQLFQTDLRIMMQQAWCPYDANLLWLHSMNFLLQMHLRTSLRRSLDDHSDCTVERCRHVQIDARTYHVSHISQSCTCDLFIADVSQMEAILRSGSIPVLRAHKSSTGDFGELAIQPWNPGADFVAISHVWADGLGNPIANELPACRLRKLFRKVSEVLEQVNGGETSDTISIWLDTVCCPVTPFELRTMAISRMKETYASAACTIVLDHHLQLTEIRGLSFEEVGCEIVASRWMGRLWTLQEGGVSQKLVVCFQDAIVNVYNVLKLIEQELSRKLTIGSLGAEPYFRLRGMMDLLFRGEDQGNPSGPINVLSSVVDAVESRGVSVLSDEPLCLLTAIGESPSARSGDVEEDMCLFWSAVARKEGVGFAALLHGLPRLSKRGFRWAPRSLLFQNHNIYRNSRRGLVAALGPMDGAVRCHFSPGGLTVQTPGYSIFGAGQRSTLEVLDSIESSPSSFASVETKRVMARCQEENRWYNLFFFMDLLSLFTPEDFSHEFGILLPSNTSHRKAQRVFFTEILGFEPNLITVNPGATCLMQPLSNEDGRSLDELIQSTSEPTIKSADGRLELPAFLGNYGLLPHMSFERADAVLTRVKTEIRDGFYLVMGVPLPETQNWLIT